MHAEEVLRDRRHKLTADGLKHYVHLATDDKAQAETAWAEAKLDEMRRKAGF